MGNYISCTLAPPLMRNAKATRVVFPTGEVKQFKEIVKAAELMLENPNYFLVNSRSLHIGRRFSALAADEELEFGNVYIFFPMRRLNSVVTAADMAVLFLAANSAAKRLSAGKARVIPDNGGQHAEEESNSETRDVPRLSLEGVESGFRYRLTLSSSLKLPFSSPIQAAAASRSAASSVRSSLQIAVQFVVQVAPFSLRFVRAARLRFVRAVQPPRRSGRSGRAVQPPFCSVRRSAASLRRSCSSCLSSPFSRIVVAVQPCSSDRSRSWSPFSRRLSPTLRAAAVSQVMAQMKLHALFLVH
ncbi:hypothetical protein SESBI_43814 [Sesbania bispinosa]|nr:hypothetical protein SESBI_43814 [Sesbania bispinosa]